MAYLTLGRSDVFHEGLTKSASTKIAKSATKCGKGDDDWIPRSSKDWILVGLTNEGGCNGVVDASTLLFIFK